MIGRRRGWVVGFSLVLALATALVQGAEERLSPAPEGSFSLVVIPDSQAYRGRGTKAEPKSEAPVTNAALEAQVKWIVDNLPSQRIVFVSHVGDLVDRNVAEQWEVARRVMDRLHGRVPYAIAPGNHDLKASGDASLFQHYFPASRFAGFAWYGGTIEAPAGQANDGNNANSFQLFSAGGLRFVFLHLTCNAPDDVLRWADEVLRRHADRRALVTTHMGLGPVERPKATADFTASPKGRMQWKKIHGQRGNTPQQMWDKCFRRHANLFLIFSGDQSRTQAMRTTTPNDAGRSVYELLSDYGLTGPNGDPVLRVCRFLPGKNRIEVSTVDPLSSVLCTGTKLVPNRAEHQFALDYAMSSEPAR
jgi:3',5'-cyclic AMP phosphodiesterase CpdA